MADRATMHSQVAVAACTIIEATASVRRRAHVDSNTNAGNSSANDLRPNKHERPRSRHRSRTHDSHERKRMSRSGRPQTGHRAIRAQSIRFDEYSVTGVASECCNLKPS